MPMPDISGTSSTDPMAGFSLAAPDPKGKKFENVPILTASGRELGKEGKGGEGTSHSMVITIKDTVSSASQDSLKVGTMTDINITLQFPPGDPELIPQYVRDNANPQNPMICPIAALLTIDRKGGLQAQMSALNQGFNLNAVNSQAFDRAMSKYDPPLSAAQKALVIQHKTAYFADPNNPLIPENTKKIMDQIKKQSVHDVRKQYGLPDLPDTETDNKAAKNASDTTTNQYAAIDEIASLNTDTQVKGGQHPHGADDSKLEEIDLDHITDQTGKPESGQSPSENENDPAKIDNQAFNEAIKTHQPALKPEQQQSIMQYLLAFSKNQMDPTIPDEVRVLLQHITENASIIKKKLQKQAIQTSTSDKSGGTSGAATQDTIESKKSVSKISGVSSVAGTQTQGPQGAQGASRANPWEAGNAYLTFELVFMKLVRILMTMKMVENTVQLNAQSLQYAMAVNTHDMMIQEAANEAQQYMTDAICQGIAFAGGIAAGVIGLGAGMYGMMSENYPTTSNTPATTVAELEPMPDIDDPNCPTKDNVSGAAKVNDFNHTAEEADANNTQIREANEDIIARNKTIATKSQILRNMNDNMQIKEAQIKENIGDTNALKDENRLDMAKSRNLASKINNDSTANEEAKANISALKKNPSPTNADGSKLSADKLSDAEIKNKQAEIEKYNTKTVGNANAEANEINAKAKAGNEIVKAQNDKIDAARDRVFAKLQGASQMLNSSFQNVTNMTSAAVKAHLAGIQGYYKAQEAILGTLGQMMGQLAQSAGDAFKADADLVNQTIQMLDSIRQKLMESVAAMLKAS